MIRKGVNRIKLYFKIGNGCVPWPINGFGGEGVVKRLTFLKNDFFLTERGENPLILVYGHLSLL